MEYYIDCVSFGDNVFTMGPFKTPPIVYASEVYVECDQPVLVRDSGGWWNLCRAATVRPFDEIGLYNYLQVRAESPDTESPDTESPDIIIEVQGGVVQEIHGIKEAANLDVRVLDHDNVDASPPGSTERTERVYLTDCISQMTELLY